jgi:cytochrome c554/c'-like protein
MFLRLWPSLCVTAMALLLTGGSPAGDAARPAVDSESINEFLGRHWQRPIAPQGTPPSGLSPLEASLAPQGCGACHPAQLSDWKTTFHARSMGPGVTGQLVELWRTDPESARLCLTCHAPLAEQQPDNRAIFNAALQAEGVVCAASRPSGLPELGRHYAALGVDALLVPAWDFDQDAWLHARMAILRGWRADSPSSGPLAEGCSP